ncbi:MAG: hypothetical protein Q8880_07015 [Bacteroidota bacterium]|nr:hypothetical protein [Bacteroidota bacterium]
MKKLLFILGFISLISLKSQAQLYNSAVGFRFGPGFFGGSYKFFRTNDNSLEGIVTFHDSFIKLSGLYELNEPIFEEMKKQLAVFFGGGVALGTGHFGNYHNDVTLIGIEGIVGIEYAFKGVPIAASLDWKPTFYLNGGTGYSGFWGNEACFTIRYTF